MSAPPFAPDAAPPQRPAELILQLDADGLVQAVECPRWVGDARPRPGEPIHRSVALEAGSIEAALERTARSGRSERVMGRLVGGGELRPVNGLLSPLPQGPGESSREGPFGGWLLALRPDSDLPTRLLAAAPGILIRAVEQMSVGLTLTDSSGRIVFANRAEAAMHGYAPEELIGRLGRELGFPGEPPPSPAALDGTPWGRQRLNRRQDGSMFPVRLVSDDVRDEGGNVLGRVTLCEDVTERVRLDRMQEEFVTVVGHELRTPLTSILGCLALLRRGDAPAERTAEALAVAERNGRHLLDLVRDLLDLERAVSGALDVELRAVPIADVLREAADRAEAGSAERRIQLDLLELAKRPDGRPATVLADRHRLLQVLGHLLSNALKFSPAKEPVRLGALPGAERTTLVVADRGPGIPDTFRHRLFEPFLQADASTTRPAGGAGLGLALARALTERMGGTLEVADGAAAEGHGTTLHVDLPNG